MQNTIYRCLLGVCIYTVVFLHLCASLRSAGLNKETTYLLTYKNRLHRWTHYRFAVAVCCCNDSELLVDKIIQTQEFGFDIDETARIPNPWIIIP